MNASGSGPVRGDLVRTDLLVLAFALFVAGYALWSELDYARFESDGARVEALIERVEAQGSGRRVRHYLHYAYDYGGKAYRFHDRDDHDRLDELYTATWNAFVAPDPPLAAGKRIGLLVDRAAPERHRPDRARLQLPWLLPLRTGGALLFLTAVGAWMWRRQRSRPAPPSTRR